MKIQQVLWYHQFVEKLWYKHHVSTEEAEQALQNHHCVRRVKRGHVKGKDVYLALGQANAGRHLAVFFIYKKSHDVIVISARDMDDKERDEYERA